MRVKDGTTHRRVYIQCPKKERPRSGCFRATRMKEPAAARGRSATPGRSSLIAGRPIAAPPTVCRPRVQSSPFDALATVTTLSTDVRQTATPLSNAELEDLDQFLLSDMVSEEALSLSGLDGYLAAIVAGPVTILPSQWLPGVWGSTDGDAPTYESVAQAQHILGLILRYMNDMVQTLGNDPGAFVPRFDAMQYPGQSRAYLDGEMWAHSFLQGIALTRKDWQPLFDDAAMVQALRPIHLLGSEDVTADDEALTGTPEQREELAKQIPGAVAKIYQYWLPNRKAGARSSAPSILMPAIRSHPKVGRNDPCPCGSGKKFKKCCGAPATLH
ncbi:MAG: UPF0149 family protein [Rhodanobacteraceae bacterium]